MEAHPAMPTALDAYERTARCYDVFTAHHDYDVWLGNLLGELRAHGLRPGRLLDVGCGTGKSFLPLLRDGWDVVGVDVSPAMLAVAATKVGDAATLRCHDMRSLPRLGSFDLVWCLDDAMNYLLTSEELERSLDGMRRNLAGHGLCLFDVNTLASYRGFFAERHELEADPWLLSWDGRAAPDANPGCTVEAHLEISRGGQPVEVAVHRQRHFTAGEIEAALATAGLQHVATFGHGPDAVLEQPLDEARHVKAVYIARTTRR